VEQGAASAFDQAQARVHLVGAVDRDIDFLNIPEGDQWDAKISREIRC
jgi:hypothetical protein